MTSSPEPAANPNMSRPAYCPLCGAPVEKDELKCKNCGWEIQEIYNYDCYPPSESESVSEEDKEKGVLLSCKNAWLTETEFHYCNEKGQILNMAEACVNAKGLLAIRFNEGKTEQFRLAPDNNALDSRDMRRNDPINGKLGPGSRVPYLGTVGTIIGEIRTLNENSTDKSAEWAAAINMLISKRNHETINCYRCWTENKSTEHRCIHCGATL